MSRAADVQKNGVSSSWVQRRLGSWAPDTRQEQSGPAGTPGHPRPGVSAELTGGRGRCGVALLGGHLGPLCPVHALRG